MSSSNYRQPPYWLAAAVWFTGLLAAGQELEISVSPSPVGSGARAAGMADAFVAIADDATAASWNPAGLVQLERPEFSIVGSFNAVCEEFGADFHPELDSRHNVNNADLNYLSVALPLPFLILGRNATFSLNYQRKYDFTRKFKLDFDTASATALGTPINTYLDFSFEQEGGLSTVSPAFAIELTHRLSVGAALNVWRSTFLSRNGWKQTTASENLTFFGPAIQYSTLHVVEKYEDFAGENATLGLLWSVNDRWSIGLRYDSAFTGSANYSRKGSTINMTLPSAAVPNGFLSVLPTVDKHQREIHFPDSLAVGAAHRVNDRLTLAADITATDWNDFHVKDRDRNKRSLVDFSNFKNPWTRSRFDRTYTVRFGAEYLFVPREPEKIRGPLWTLRGGLFYDQEPASGRSSGFRWPGDNGDGNPDSFYGVAVGAGVQIKRRFNIDIAYQLRYGDDVNADFIRGIPGFSEDVFQHRALVSTVIYF